MKIALIANTGWYLYNFRRNLVRRLRSDGHDVVLVCPVDDYVGRLVADGAAHLPWRLDSAGLNPVSEIRSILSLRRGLRAAGVELIFSFTPKANLYSGLAALGSSCVTVPNISGLGRAFTQKGWLSRVVTPLYRVVLSRAPVVFFQNEEDRDWFVQEGLVQRDRSVRLMGSGVDLDRFTAAPLPCATTGGGAPVVFLLAARLLWEKGIAQYVDAARALRRSHPDVRFLLVGPLAGSGGHVVRQSDIDGWAQEGLIEYVGATDDMPAVLRTADCVVLPSYYREGVPRTLLEAAATGRPCITTDMPGCRDAVEHGVTGWTCKAQDSAALMACMHEFLEMDPQQRAAMGAQARARAERLFSEAQITALYGKALAAAQGR